MGDQQESKLTKVEFLENRYVDEDGNIYKKDKDSFINLTPSKPDTSRYLRTWVFCNIKNKRRSVLLHRIIASVFLNQPFYNDFEVNHINGDRLDNRACNLEYVTRKENMSHAFKTGLNSNSGVKNGRALISPETAVEIYNKLFEGKGNKELSEIYRVSTSAISSIKRKKIWREHLQELPDIPIKPKANKLTDEIVVSICEDILQGFTPLKIIKRYPNYNLKVHQIEDIKRCKGYRHITEKYFKV